MSSATVVVITPGVDMAVVTRNALLDGRRAALLTALGINLGVLFWVTAAAQGLAAVVAASAPAFAAIKLAGASYALSRRAAGTSSAALRSSAPSTAQPGSS